MRTQHKPQCRDGPMTDSHTCRDSDTRCALLDVRPCAALHIRHANHRAPRHLGQAARGAQGSRRTRPGRARARREDQPAVPQKLENGHHAPSDAARIRLAAALGTTVPDLFPHDLLSPRTRHERASPLPHRRRPPRMLTLTARLVVADRLFPSSAAPRPHPAAHPRRPIPLVRRRPRRDRRRRQSRHRHAARPTRTALGMNSPARKGNSWKFPLARCPQGALRCSGVAEHRDR